MQWKSGRTRWTLVMPELGIVVKFPHIRIWTSFKELRWRGLRANLIEFWLYATTRNPFLQPTYFSFFGLVNIQRYGEPCNLKSTDVWCQLIELTDKKVWADSHHFAGPENFTIVDGAFRMLDYGSIGVVQVVKEYGRKISESFDVTYSWEEKCKTTK